MAWIFELSFATSQVTLKNVTIPLIGSFSFTVLFSGTRSLSQTEYPSFPLIDQPSVAHASPGGSVWRVDPTPFQPFVCDVDL